MNLQLNGKVMMVAASSKGLGYGIARALASEGARVAVASRTKDDIEAAATRLRDETGADVRAYVLDAADAASIRNWTSDVLRDFGSIHGLVVNAGGPPPGGFDAFDDADWEAAFNLTLMSAVRMIRSVLPTMREQGSGSILTVTSSSIKEPIDILLLSNVFRSGVVSLVKSLSRDLAPQGIRINNLVPGMIDTDRIRSNDAFAAEKAGVPVDVQAARRQEGIPMGRYGTTDEFGRTAAFLLSDAAAYITGATLLVDGGKSRTVW